MVVAPLLVEPDLFPQLVSDLESIKAWPPESISPRTVSADGRPVMGLIFMTVTRIHCFTLGPGPVFVGVQPIALTTRSLAVGPSVTATVNTPTWLALIVTGVATLPSNGAANGPTRLAMPLALAGLLRAQIARSTPLSATPRAWATWSWL